MSRTTLNDFQDATEAIDALLGKYDARKGQKWLKQDVLEQHVHVYNHSDIIGQMIRPVPMEVFNFEEFVSLACRGLMLLEHAILKYPDEYKKWKEEARKKESAEAACTIK